MFAVKSLCFFGVIALSVYANRVIRSPDKFEVDIPHQSIERESGEYEANMNEETAYWQGQGDKLGDNGEEGHKQLDEDREKNQENYEHEKDHYQDQQHNYNKEMNETYQEDKTKTEAHYETNQEHYNQHHNNTHHEYQGNRTAEDLAATETGDRYGEKGTQYQEEGNNKVENYDVNGNSPSASYTRT